MLRDFIQLCTKTLDMRPLGLAHLLKEVTDAVSVEKLSHHYTVRSFQLKTYRKKTAPAATAVSCVYDQLAGLALRMRPRSGLTLQRAVLRAKSLLAVSVEDEV